MFKKLLWFILEELGLEKPKSYKPMTPIQRHNLYARKHNRSKIR